MVRIVMKRRHEVYNLPRKLDMMNMNLNLLLIKLLMNNALCMMMELAWMDIRLTSSTAGGSDK